MRKTPLITALILTTVLSCTTAFTQSYEIRNHSAFTKVKFSVVGNINIRIGAEFKVALEGDSERLAETQTKVSNGKLIIREKKWRNRRRSQDNADTKKVTVNITMPAISELSVSGIGTAEVIDSFKAESLNLNVRGISKIILNDVSGKYLNCNAKGISHIIIQGNGSFENADMKIKGISSYTGDSLIIETAELKISGIGKCNIYVSKDIKAKEIELIIKSLKTKNPYGYDKISTKILKISCSFHKFSNKLHM